MSTATVPRLKPDTAPDRLLEDWLNSHIRWVVATALLAGFVSRLLTATGTFLNPDEALHHLLVNQSTLWEAYKASLTNAHPPLYFVLLYYWRFLGSSELMLRLPSILASTGAAWMAYKWIELVLGRVAGLTTLYLLALTPMLITLGAEVRNYSLLLLLVSSALYFLERAFKNGTVSSVVYGGLCLYGAILTHYSAVWFVIPAGIYVLLRISHLRPSARATWALFQVGGAAIYVWLYIVHISRMRGSGMEAGAMQGWLQAMYYRASEGHLHFVRRNIVDVFQFTFSSVYAGNIAWAMFIAGILWLAISAVLRSRRDLAAFVALLIMPFGLGAAASIADVYPFGGTRHCAYLVLFATAGVSFLFSKIAGQRILPVLLLAGAFVAYANTHRLKDPQHIDRKDQSLELMNAAIEDLRTSIPAPGPIVSDYQASILLEYYLSRDQVPPAARKCGGSSELRYGSYRVIVVGEWSVTAEQLNRALNDWRSSGCDSGPGDSVWTFDAGWWPNLLDVFKYSAPRSVSRGHWYGGSISLFQLQNGER